jgi:putative Holliday junction resolvase
VPRVLAVDPGTVRVGLARTDDSGVLAVPMGAISAQPGETLVARLAAAAAEVGAEEIVVGHPRRLDGSEGEEARAARRLAHDLRRATAARVTLVDERLTSAQAERALLAAGASRRRRRASSDQVAATLILQQYLASRDG